MQLRHSGHSVYKTEYHITWIPKCRRRLLNPGVAGYLSKLFPAILEELPGCEILEKNIQIDHLHLVMIIPPRYSVSSVVGRMKHHSSQALRKKFAYLAQVSRRNFALWSEGYFVSTIGLNEAQILEYVKFQERQDLGQAKLELWR